MFPPPFCLTGHQRIRSFHLEDVTRSAILLPNPARSEEQRLRMIPDLEEIVEGGFWAGAKGKWRGEKEFILYTPQIQLYLFFSMLLPDCPLSALDHSLLPCKYPLQCAKCVSHTHTHNPSELLLFCFICSFYLSIYLLITLCFSSSFILMIISQEVEKGGEGSSLLPYFIHHSVFKEVGLSSKRRCHWGEKKVSL